MVPPILYLTENARGETYDNIYKYRVDRYDELKLLIDTFKFSDGNVFLYGKRGVGKSFLLKMLEIELKNRLPEIFVFYLPVVGLEYIRAHYPDKAVFPIAFLKAMLESAWRSLGKHNYVDLISENQIKRKGKETEESYYNYMKWLASNIYANKRSSVYKRSASLGASAILKGEINEEHIEKNDYPNLVVQDIYLHFDELKKILSEKFGKKKIIVLCDEINILSENYQQDIITQHLHMFFNYPVQFVFVAGFVGGLKSINVSDYFDVMLRINGMSEEHIFEMIRKKCKIYGYDCEKNAAGIICEESDGNPRIALLISNLALHYLEGGTGKIITSKLAKVASGEHKYKVEELYGEIS